MSLKYIVGEPLFGRVTNPGNELRQPVPIRRGAMMDRSEVETGFLGPSPPRKIVRVSITAPLTWIKGGIGDFLQAPLLSLFFGGVFAGMFYLGSELFLAASGPRLGYLAWLAFLIPFLVAGVNAAGRDLEGGRMPKVLNSIRILWIRKAYLALFSLMVTALILGWVRLTAQIFVVYTNSAVISTDTARTLLADPHGLIAVGFFTLITMLVALFIFFGSAVALPLVLDGDAEFINAMITSYQATIQNPRAMLLWAALVFILTTMGIAAWYIGLALVFPILSYASWRSYRDLVR